MNELTLKFDSSTWLDEKNIKEYLSSLKGVLKVHISESKEELHIKYNASLTCATILKLEILLFNSSLKIPSIIAFNKHSKNNLQEAAIVIKDICCEYCFKHMIEELFLVEGIISAYSDYGNNYKNSKLVTINITYDSKLITKKDIGNIETKLNAFKELKEEK